MSALGQDRAAISAVIDRFFAAFRSGPDAGEHSNDLREVLLPEAVIVRASGQTPTVYSVDTFIAPRVELLRSGALRDFREWVTGTRIDVFGDIAQVWCSYAKSWTADDGDHHEQGMKTAQLIRTDAGWRISALAWDDERPGLVVSTVDARR